MQLSICASWSRNGAVEEGVKVKTADFRGRVLDTTAFIAAIWESDVLCLRLHSLLLLLFVCLKHFCQSGVHDPFERLMLVYLLLSIGLFGLLLVALTLESALCGILRQVGGGSPRLREVNAQDPEWSRRQRTRCPPIPQLSEQRRVS